METRIAGCPLGAKCEEVKQEHGKPVLYRCPWYVMVRGTDINTGKEVDEWNCAIAWMPMLQINTANESRKGVAATENFRNLVVPEMRRQNDQAALAALRAVRLSDVDLLEGEHEANNY
jgi:hypothetical protein